MVQSDTADQHSATFYLPGFRYGCRGNDCRRNVQVLGSGEMVYFISNICIILDRVTNTQRHYKEHSEDVKW